jgi:hypothetical protein
VAREALAVNPSKVLALSPTTSLVRIVSNGLRIITLMTDDVYLIINKALHDSIS